MSAAGGLRMLILRMMWASSTGKAKRGVEDSIDSAIVEARLRAIDSGADRPVPLGKFKGRIGIKGSAKASARKS